MPRPILFAMTFEEVDFPPAPPPGAAAEPPPKVEGPVGVPDPKALCGAGAGFWGAKVGLGATAGGVVMMGDNATCCC